MRGEPTWWNGAPGREHDPGRASGRREAPAFRCVDCGYRGDASGAVSHHHRTGHGIVDRHGVRQQFSPLPRYWGAGD